MEELRKCREGESFQSECEREESDGERGRERAEAFVEKKREKS